MSLTDIAVLDFTNFRIIIYKVVFGISSKALEACVYEPFPELKEECYLLSLGCCDVDSFWQSCT